MRRLERLRLRTPNEVVYDENGNVREWDSHANSVNNFKSGFRLIAYPNQERRCAYCGHKIGDASRSDQDIDHFAPKSIYPQWTFMVDNLLLACIRCNRRRKRDYNPVEPEAATYANCRFKIFHPYFHLAEDHFEGGYTDTRTRPSIPVGKSPEGIETIRLFDLIDPSLIVIWIDDFLNALHAEGQTYQELADVYEERQRFQRRIDEHERVEREKWVQNNLAILLREAGGQI